MANQHLYFTKTKYYPLKAFFPSLAMSICSINDIDANEAIILVTGIANPQPLVEIVNSYSTHVQTCIFPDHHQFTLADIQLIDAKFRKVSTLSRRILTTEKDAMRLKLLDFLPDAWRPFLYYIPVSIEFLFEQGENFDSRILTHVVSTININKKNAKN